MPVLSFKKAKATGLIKEKEIERLAAIFLTVADQVKVDMKTHTLVAGELDSTPGSTQVLFLKTLRALRENKCFIGEDGDGEGGGEGKASATPKETPTKTSAKTSKASPKKRKASDEDVAGEKTTPKKARGKKALAEVKDADTITVKVEEVPEGSEAPAVTASE